MVSHGYISGFPLHVTEWADVLRWWPRSGAETEKYSRGLVGVATGSAIYPGAGVLSVGGAVCGPTGLVRYAGGAREEVAALRDLDSLADHQRANAEGRIEFELSRTPDLCDTRIARASGTNVVLVKQVRARLDAYPTRPV